YLATIILSFMLFARTESRLSKSAEMDKVGKSDKPDAARPHTSKIQRMPPSVLFLVVCLELPLIYLNILTFAYRIYPYIPAGRGGGDYTIERMATLVLDQQFTNAIPPTLLTNEAHIVETKPVYVLHQTPATIVVALPCRYIVQKRSSTVTRRTAFRTVV